MADIKFYSKKEAADVLGVHFRTVERYLKSGELKGARFKKAWRISEEDIRAFYEETKAETARKINARKKDT